MSVSAGCGGVILVCSKLGSDLSINTVLFKVHFQLLPSLLRSFLSPSSSIFDQKRL